MTDARAVSAPDAAARTHRLAAIDIGTVTTRLLVADVGPAGIIEVERSTDITHLGTGVDETGMLDSAAMERVGTVVDRYAVRMRELGVERYRAMATSASRDAGNADHFVARIAAAGITLDVIAGHREAELSFWGACAAREGRDLLVVDCGGGSTELIVGDVSRDRDGHRDSGNDRNRDHDREAGLGGGRHGAHIRLARSIDVGSRRLTDRFLRHDPPLPEELAAGRAWVEGEMAGYFASLSAPPARMIALAGTATTLAAIDQHLDPYDPARVEGYVVDRARCGQILARLAAMPVSERRHVTGLHPQRAEVIVAGAIILDTVLALTGLDAMTVSEHDILYGILLDTYAEGTG